MFVPLIGLVVDVTIRLKNVQEKSLTEISSENKVGKTILRPNCYTYAPILARLNC